MRIFTPDRRAALRRSSHARHGRRWWASPSSVRRSASRPGWGSCVRRVRRERAGVAERGRSSSRSRPGARSPTRGRCWRPSAWTRSQLPVECYENGPRHVLVALATAQEVARLRPDLAGPRRAGQAQRQLLRPFGRTLEDAHVRPRDRGAGGPSDRLGRGPAGGPPRAPRPDRLRRGASRSSREPRSGVPRCCRRAQSATSGPCRRLRSAARWWPSRAGNSRCAAGAYAPGADL